MVGNMNTPIIKYTPLTAEDILALRGNPLAKKIEALKDSLNQTKEEWTYYNAWTDSMESYVFKDGELIAYKNNE